MDGLSDGFSVCTLTASFLKTKSGMECDYDIREIDEDLYLAVLQTSKQAQSPA